MPIVIVTLFLLALISFWVLGYSHMRFQNQVRLESRRFRSEQMTLKQKIEALSREKKTCEESIAALEETIRSLRTEDVP